MLVPMNGYALVKLTDKYDSGLSVDKEKYESITSGLLLEIAGFNLDDKFVGSTVYFKEYESSEVIYENDEQYVFVPMTKVMGFKIGDDNA